MSSKLFIVLSLVALGSCASISDPDWSTQVVDGGALPTDVQQYLDNQLAEDKEVVELVEPPEALQKACATLLEKESTEPERSRMKRKVVVCRYIAITNRRTKKTTVIVRCPRK